MSHTGGSILLHWIVLRGLSSNPLYLVKKWDLFRLCTPSLVGAYYLHPPDARAIFLHSDLLCNGTCSVTGGCITYWGGTNGKDPKNDRKICFCGNFKYAAVMFHIGGSLFRSLGRSYPFFKKREYEN